MWRCGNTVNNIEVVCTVCSAFLCHISMNFLYLNVAKVWQNITYFIALVALDAALL